MRRTTIILMLALVLAGTLAACGDDAGNEDGSTPTGTQPVAPIPSSTSGNGPPTVAAAPTTTPGGSAEEATPAVPLEFLGTMTLRDNDVPFGFRLRSSLPVTAREVVTAQIAIPAVAGYSEDAAVQGAWAMLYTREQPNSGLSSIVYQFPSDEAAAGFVATVAGLTNSAYPGAVSVEPLLAETVGDVSAMMRYRLSGSRTLEVTWAQGSRVGQILLRHVGDVESPDDVELLLGLARIQSQKMAEAAQ